MGLFWKRNGDGIDADRARCGRPPSTEGWDRCCSSTNSFKRRTFRWRLGSQTHTINPLNKVQFADMTSSFEIALEGMSCQHCVSRVRETLEALEGIEVQDVRIGAATVRMDSERITLDEVEDALRTVGYEPV